MFGECGRECSTINTRVSQDVNGREKAEEVFPASFLSLQVCNSFDFYHGNKSSMSVATYKEGNRKPRDSNHV